MREDISVKNKKPRSGLSFFQGNITVIAVSSAVKAFGGGSFRFTINGAGG